MRRACKRVVECLFVKSDETKETKETKRKNHTYKRRNIDIFCTSYIVLVAALSIRCQGSRTDFIYFLHCIENLLSLLEA